MARASPAVSIVIPAFNAAATIVETLRSVSSQTFEDFEIIVVDDGSVDGTAEIIAQYARSEPRLRLVRQANAGVAAARNAAVALAAAPYVAPIDADDLWRPTRLAKHLAALERRSAAVFAYSPFRALNRDGRVIGSHPNFGFEGAVFHRQLFFNMVGNGSGVTFRKDAFLRVGGYDNALREAHLEGSEDWLLQMRLSLIGEVTQVPEYLIGYRKAPGAMSADPRRIWRSQIFALDRLKPHAPSASLSAIEAAKLHFAVRAALESVRRADLPALATAFRAAADRGLAPQLFGEVREALARAARAKARRRAPPGPFFADADPSDRPEIHLSQYTRKLIERLRVLDEQWAMSQTSAR